MIIKSLLQNRRLPNLFGLIKSSECGRDNDNDGMPSQMRVDGCINKCSRYQDTVPHGHWKYHGAGKGRKMLQMVVCGTVKLGSGVQQSFEPQRKRLASRSPIRDSSCSFFVRRGWNNKIIG